MALIVVYGVNAAGKDAIAKEIQSKINHNAIITSDSRLLMYCLGIIDGYSCDVVVGREHYKALEDTPQERMIEVENTTYKNLIHTLSQSDHTTILLSHLVFALSVDKEKPIFLTEREIPEFMYEAVDGFINILVTPEELQRRRKKDSEECGRDRGGMSLEQIKYHQFLCDERWIRLEQKVGAGKVRVIINDYGMLKESTKRALRFIQDILVAKQIKQKIVLDESVAKLTAEIIVNSGSYISKYDQPRESWARLPDGTTTPCYCNCRWLFSNVHDYKQIANHLKSIVIKNNLLNGVTTIVGLATAGIPWAAILAEEFNVPLSYVRSNAKSYGVGKLVECYPPQSGKALIVDDACFTGESVVKAITALEEEFDISTVRVLSIVALSDWSVDENSWAFFAEKSIDVHALTQYGFILEAALQSALLTEKQSLEMMGYYKNPRTYTFASS